MRRLPMKPECADTETGQLLTVSVCAAVIVETIHLDKLCAEATFLLLQPLKQMNKFLCFGGILIQEESFSNI